MSYIDTRKFIEAQFAGRLCMHKFTKKIYLDGKPFKISKFREKVFREQGILLDDLELIHKIVRFYAAQRELSNVEDYLNKRLEADPSLTYDNIKDGLDWLSSENNSRISKSLEETYPTQAEDTTSLGNKRKKYYFSDGGYFSDDEDTTSLGNKHKKHYFLSDDEDFPE